MNYYPYKFQPLLKKIIWGGDKITKFKGLDTQLSEIGESWEVSDVEGSVSIVENGDQKGKSLSELLQLAPVEILGDKVFKKFGQRFPLLIKFIDAEKDLSIQVHPDDAMAATRHNGKGKTEMWYVIESKPGSKLISGFNRKVEPEELEGLIKEDKIVDVLRSYEVKKGDVFFLPAGRIHAIGAGLFVAEIQQTSDITYRIYDYKRTDANGNERELHIDLAKEAIDYNSYEDLYTVIDSPDEDKEPLVSCNYFETNLITVSVEKPVSYDYSNLDSFKIYICTEGSGKIYFDADNYIDIKQGETALVPAIIKSLRFSAQTELKLIETYIFA